MNREARLRKVVPGANDALIAALAAKPIGEVDVVVAALRQARRDERQHQAERRREAKRDARRFRHYDAEDLAARNLRMIGSAGRMAADGDLAALAGLAEFMRHADRLTALAVAGLRRRASLTGRSGPR